MIPERVIIRLGNIALFCGVLYVFAGLMGFVNLLIPAIPILVFTICIAIGSSFKLLGYIGIYLVQAERIRTLGFASFALIIIGNVLHLRSFFFPTGYVVYILGLLLLAFVNTRGKVFPNYLMWSIFFIVFIWVFIGYLNFIPAQVGINQKYLKLIIRTFEFGICPLVFGILMMMAGQKIKDKFK